MAQTHEFHSPLPPERIPDILAGEWETCDQTANLEVCIRIKWKGPRVAVERTTVRRYAAADGRVSRVHGVGWTKGRRTDWQWNDPFCGEVHSDGRGGSILTGRFHTHPAGKLIFAIFPLIIVYSFWLLPPTMWRRWQERSSRWRCIYVTSSTPAGPLTPMMGSKTFCAFYGNIFRK